MRESIACFAQYDLTYQIAPVPNVPSETASLRGQPDCSGHITDVSRAMVTALRFEMRQMESADMAGHGRCPLPRTGIGPTRRGNSAQPQPPDTLDQSWDTISRQSAQKRRHSPVESGSTGETTPQISSLFFDFHVAGERTKPELAPLLLKFDPDNLRRKWLPSEFSNPSFREIVDLPIPENVIAITPRPPV